MRLFYLQKNLQFIELNTCFNRTMSVSKFIFHPQQIYSSNHLLDAFTNKGIMYAILLAQMQSGKSGAYLRLALESIHSKKFKRVLIISGSRDTSLKGQTIKNLEEAIESFSKEVNGDDWEDWSYVASGRISVCWSQDMDKNIKVSDLSDILIINDESHYAQSKTNIPYINFFSKFGIEKSLSGDFSSLKEKNIRILSVSATPFSELIQDHKMDLGILSEINIALESKHFYIMTPGDGYLGIIFFHNNGNIHYSSQQISDECTRHIRKVLNSDKYNNKYCIIRTKNAVQDEHLINCIANDCDYNYIKVFGGGNEDAFDFMNDQPEKRSIVHICGKARMGQVLPKEYIGMVYEQSANPGVDTILQGLLGRMCGYHKNTDIDIFIPKSRKEHIVHYINSLRMGLDSIESKTEIAQIAPASNVSKKKVHIHTDDELTFDKKNNPFIGIVPIKLNKSVFNGEQRNTIKYIFDQYPSLLTNNKDGNIIMKILEKDDKIFHRKITSGDSYEKRNIIGRLNYSIENRIKFRDTYNYIITDPDEITTFFGIYENGEDIYFVGFIPYKGEYKQLSKHILPSVSDECSYKSPHQIKMEDDSIIVGINGGQMIKFPHETSSCRKAFYKELQLAILRTLPKSKYYIEGCVSAINSNWCGEGKEYKGIMFDKKIFTDKYLKSRADKIIDLYNITITYEKFRGRQPTDYIRFKSISW